MKNKAKNISTEPLSYKKAGVDINAGNKLVQKINPFTISTQRSGTFAGLGGFGALFDLKAAGFHDPILVAATDGVGTKLRIAIETANLKTIGIDLVAMCVNDLICQGAEPLFFLDYYATAKLNIEEAASVIEGIATGCRLSNTALIGGETAEMPDMYHNSDFDLAGFAVGALNRGEILPKGISAGDVLVGLKSSGVHSNGFSLVRMIVKNLGLNWESPIPFSEKNLGSELLEPTKIYVHPIMSLKQKKLLSGVAHITGGGLTENLPRILEPFHGAKINLDSFKIPDLLKWLLFNSGVSEEEALKTFNCGIGMVLVVKKNKVSEVESILKDHSEIFSIIGKITTTPGIEYTGTLGI